MTKTIPLVLIVLLTAVVAVGGTYWFAKRAELDVDVTVESITKIAKLSTIEYRVAAYEHYKSEKMTAYFSTIPYRHEFLCIVKGIIEGKVNLKKADIRIEKGDEAGGQIFIRFGEGSVEVSQLHGGEDIGEMITIQDPKTDSLKYKQKEKDALRETARKQARQAAIDDGIVSKTQDEAVVVISEFVRALGWTAVVEFDENAFSG